MEKQLYAKMVKSLVTKLENEPYYFDDESSSDEDLWIKNIYVIQDCKLTVTYMSSFTMKKINWLIILLWLCNFMFALYHLYL